MAELAEQTLHQAKSAGIDCFHTADALKSVGQIAATAARDGHLCQRTAAALIDIDDGVGMTAS